MYLSGTGYHVLAHHHAYRSQWISAFIIDETVNRLDGNIIFYGSLLNLFARLSSEFTLLNLENACWTTIHRIAYWQIWTPSSIFRWGYVVSQGPQCIGTETLSTLTLWKTFDKNWNSKSLSKRKESFDNYYLGIKNFDLLHLYNWISFFVSM